MKKVVLALRSVGFCKGGIMKFSDMYIIRKIFEHERGYYENTFWAFAEVLDFCEMRGYHKSFWYWCI